MEFARRFSTGLLGAILVCSIWSPVATNAAEQRPNILFISLDDLNDWIEPMGGHPQSKTPRLAAFAEEAVTFRNAYCASPSCNPSRVAMMTGKNPNVTGVYDNPQIWRHILPNETTLPEYFKQQGYWTGGAGKLFHNNMPDPRSWNAYFPSLIQHFPLYYLPDVTKSGTKYFRLQDNEIREDDPKGITLNMPNSKGMYIAFDWAPLPVETEETGDYSSVKWVMDQLDKKHDKPFFLGCGIYRPHLPFYVPQKYFDRFPLDEIQLPKILDTDQDDLTETGKKLSKRYHENVTANGQWKKAVQGYLASINYADDLTGQLLDALAKSAYAENTIVVVFSDHGWQLGEKQHWQKHALWENVIKSVLMIRTPKGVLGEAKGKPCFQNVSLVDIFPTLTELCELPNKPGLSGKSLIPLLENPERSDWDHPVVTVLGDAHWSVRKGNWHYIQYNNGKEEELYELKSDPEEWTNLAENPKYKERIAALKAALPTDRKENKKTKPIRWADVLAGETQFYE